MPSGTEVRFRRSLSTACGDSNCFDSGITEGESHITCHDLLNVVVKLVAPTIRTSLG